MENCVAPAAAALFEDGKGRRLRVHDAFLVRYDAAGGQTGLPSHTDQSDLSGIIALSTPSSYEGGGTRFEELETVVRGEQGQVTLFEGGKHYHGGEPVLSGTRYIIACFFYWDDDDARKK
eukprot:Hpha_TRINITY_DN31773_c0_g1::TRINITY_DN31773_c0_g1_i1::g.116373::m.116373